MTTKPRIKIPDKIKAGDVIEVKTLISHVMETGNRKDKDGKAIARNIVNMFTATLDGKTVFKAELQSGISANPYIAFNVRVQANADLELTWVDDLGTRTSETVKLVVG